MARQMKDSGVEWIGQIPEDWDVARLCDIKSEKKFAIVDGPFGSAISTNDYREKGVPLIRISNLKNGEVSDEDMVYISEELAESVRRSCIGLSDIVFAKTGATIGKCGINRLIKYGILASSCIKISISHKYNCDYFYYIFSTDQFNQALRNTCTGTTRDTINLTPFSKLNVLLPPYCIQNRIASYLDRKCAEIDAIIAKQQQIIEKLKEYKLSVITEAVTKGLDPNVPMKDGGVEWIGKIPESWNIAPLKTCTDILSGYAFSSNDFDTEKGIALLRGINVTPNGIRWEDVVYWSQPVTKQLENFELSAGDIVVGLDRPWVSEGTRVCWVAEKDLPALLLQRVCRIRAKNNIDRRWIYHWIASKSFQEALSIETTGVSVPHISTKQIGQFSITLPPIEMQCQICDILETKCRAIDQTISEKQKIIANFLGYKKSLMYEVVTGKREG